MEKLGTSGKKGSKPRKHSKEVNAAKGLDLPVKVWDSNLSPTDSKTITRLTTEDQLSPKGVLEIGLGWSSKSSSSGESTSSSSSGHLSSQLQWLSRLLRLEVFRRTSTFPVACVPKPRTKDRRDVDAIPRNSTEIDSISGISKPSWRNFSLAELKAATGNFNPVNIIGKGGYAEVYKGCLEDNQVIAIKRMTRGNAEVRTNNFLSELGIIAHLNHPNITQLIGFCTEGGMHLVLQYSPHGSLSHRLHDSDEELQWDIRYNIALGTAQALEYLHEKCHRRVIHRDVKAANILLTENFEAQICDFGLAKWLPDRWTHHSLPSYEGTFGYLAPECIMHGIVDEKTDVFAFGVVLLELITGRRALDSSMKSLVIWARPLLEMNETKKLIDSSLDAYDHVQLKLMIFAASTCLQESALLRPKMSQVLKILRNEDDDLESSNLCSQRFIREQQALFDVEGCNPRIHLNDLNIHRQLNLDV